MKAENASSEQNALQRAKEAANSLSVAQDERDASITVLLRHIRANVGQKHSQRNEDTDDTLSSLQALKLLGRVPSGSEALASSSALRLLAQIAGLEDFAGLQNGKATNAQLEAWRIICNATKLHIDAAKCLETMDDILEGMVLCLGPLNSPQIQFLASRCLFLLTAKGGEINRTLVETWHIAETLCESLRHVLETEISGISSLTTDDTMALSEHLKLLYNLAIFYPRLQAIDPKSDATSPKGSQQTHANPKSPHNSPPLRSHPLSPSTSSSGSSNKIARGIKNVRSMLPSGRPGSPLPGSKRNSPERSLDSLAPQLVQLIIAWPINADTLSPLPPLSHALHCLSVLATGPDWYEPYPLASQKAFSDFLERPNAASNVTKQSTSALPPLVAKIYVSLDRHLAYSFPSADDPDAATTRTRIDQLAGESDYASLLDSALAPLILLLRKCIIGDMEKNSGDIIRELVLGDHIDRTEALDKSASLTGRLVRLMSSVYYPNTKIGAGELLFVLCRQDTDDFARMLGYGPAAGFLASNGLLVPPPEASESKDDGRDIDPITGAFRRQTSTDDSVKMTDEEKEREAERLYTLFDRLAKNGTISVENPIHKAQQEGRLEEITNDEAQRIQDQEDADEREANAEMLRWKLRRKQPAQ